MNYLYKIILSSTLLLCPFTSVTAKLTSALELPATPVKTYVNQEDNYSIEYPSDWIDPIEVAIKGLIRAKPKTNDSSSSASMSVSSEYVGDSITVEDVSAEIFSYFPDGGGYIKTGESDLNGIPSKWILYSFETNESDTQVIVLQYLIVAQETKYIITFGTTEEDFDVFLPEFESIVSSFRFLQE